MFQVWRRFVSFWLFFTFAQELSFGFGFGFANPESLRPAEIANAGSLRPAPPPPLLPPPLTLGVAGITDSLRSPLTRLGCMHFRTDLYQIVADMFITHGVPISAAVKRMVPQSSEYRFVGRPMQVGLTNCTASRFRACKPWKRYLMVSGQST